MPPQLGNFKKSKELASNHVVAVVVGFFNAAVSGLLPSLFPQLFTKSEAVIELMNQAIPFMSLSLFAHTGSMASEGCLSPRETVSSCRSYIPNSIQLHHLTILSARASCNRPDRPVPIPRRSAHHQRRRPYGLSREEIPHKLEEQTALRPTPISPSTHLPRERANELHDVAAQLTRTFFFNSW